METKSIMLVGVGGQGTILASKLLTVGLMESGYDVKMSEIHGMSQRGGAVSSQVRYGSSVASPVIEKGGADIIVAFELMEALRWLGYLKAGGKVVVNDYRVNPMPVAMGKCAYPEGIMDELKSKADVRAFDAMAEAAKLGSTKVMNVILLGALIKLMGLDGLEWDRIMKENVKPAFYELNMQALERGGALV